jgi:multiple sugar transport system substrate-binding protein
MPRVRILLALVVLAWLAVLPGCSGDAGSPPQKSAPPFAGQTVRLLVVDDPPLAAAVRSLQGEWQARSGADLQVNEITSAELTKAAGLEADAVIYPSPLIGVLAQRKWLAPLPEEFVSNPDLDWQGIGQALRDGELCWGARVMALPLGSRVLVCYYRADLLRKFNKRPPRTWAEYGELASFFADRAKLGKDAPAKEAPWYGAAEPLAEGWAGITLLARAAAYARHRDYYSVLFDLTTMEPRIASPPFERALTELVAAARPAKDALLKMTPTDTASAFVERGQCALAIGWPPAAEAALDSKKRDEKGVAPLDAAAVGCLPLPGSDESFDWSKRQFTRGEVRGVPLLACEGRLASVSRTATNTDAAVQLLIALASPEWSARLSAASPATAPFRASHVGEASRWLPENYASAASAYAQAVTESLATKEVVYALRIPGREQYIAALDRAVREAVDGKATPQEALNRAAATWREVTDKLGKEAQRAACQDSVVRVGR